MIDIGYTIESREPRAESREPRAESREPRAESREPRAESREPRAESREPRAESREPRAESREPRAESREPRAESREPRAESREPRAESREPRAESREPRAESREPRAESREPRPRRGSPPSTSAPLRAPLLRSVADFPAAGAPAASVCPDTGEAGRSVSGVFRRLGFAVRRGTGGRATRARSGLCAAAGLLLAFAAFLALPLQAQAQTIQTLVSNTGQTSNFNLAVGVSGSNTFAQALGFTTGDNTNGYTLSSVEVSFNASFDSTDEVRVSIYGADASGKPGSSLHVLVNPSSIPDAVQINSFNAPANATLAKETVYFVVVEAPTGTFAITGTSSAAEDSGKANGWAINDTRHDRFSDSGSWSLGGSNTKPKIAVKGTAKAPSTDATLSDLVVNDGTTDLTLDPTFVSGTFAYTTDVASSVEEVTLTATPNTGASVSAVTLGGTAIADTDFTDGITVPSLIVGENVIVVTVTAEDTTTMKTYTVTVTQEAPTITAPAIVTGGVQVRSMPIATPDTYGLGETIEITVTFDHAVTVDTSGGTPRIQFRFDGAVNQVGRVQQRFGGHGPGVHLCGAVRRHGRRWHLA